MRSRALALLAALSGGIVAVAAPVAAEQVWSGLDEQTWRIFSGSSAGQPLRLDGLAAGGDQGAPALSPDGSRLAVEVTGEGIGVCSLASATCTRLANLPGVAAHPAWDPKTGQLLFALYSFDASSEDSDLWAVGSDLEDPRPLVVQTGIQDDPDVSPDGRTLVYSSGQTVQLRRAASRVVRHLWTMDLVSGRARPLIPTVAQDKQPDWSPDGRSIAFASDRSGRFEIWVVDANGGEPRQVTSGEGSKTWPAWSPDGRSLVFTWSVEGRYGLGRVDVDGSGLAPLVPMGADTRAQMRDPDWR